MRKSRVAIAAYLLAVWCAVSFVKAQTCVSNGRTTMTGQDCCFPATFQGRTYNDCWAYDEESYCSTSNRTSRTTMARCAPRNSTGSGNGTLPSGVNNAFSNAFGGAPQASASASQAMNSFQQAFAPAASNRSADVPSAMNNFQQAFEPGAMNPRPAAPAVAPSLAAAFGPQTQKPAVRYTVDDQQCIFPYSVNGTIYYDCFSMPGSLDTSSEASSATGLQYCFVSSSPDVAPVQCAAAGYTPGTQTAPTGLCPTQKTRTTTTGKTCTFPQQNAVKRWVCDCYSLQTMEEPSTDSAPFLACVPDGESSPVQCASSSGSSSSASAPTTSQQAPAQGPAPAPSTSSGANTASNGGSSSGGSSSNALAIGLGVGIPLGIAAIAALVGGIWYYKKKRPVAKATSFTKWDGGEQGIKGGAISSKDVQKTGAGLSEVSRYAEQL